MNKAVFERPVVERAATIEARGTLAPAGDDEPSPYMLTWEEMTPCQRLGSEFGAIFRRERSEESASPALMPIVARFGGWEAFPDGAPNPPWEEFRAAYNAVVRERAAHPG